MAHGACHSCGAAFEDCECTVSTGISATGRLIDRTPPDPMRHEPLSDQPVGLGIDYGALERRLPFPPYLSAFLIDLVHDGAHDDVARAVYGEPPRVKRTAEDLAMEAAVCIETYGLRGEELWTYLAAWLADCAVDGDLDAIRRGRDLASRRHDRAMKKRSPK